MNKRICENEECRKPYTPKRRWQRFCEPACRQAVRNRELAGRYQTPTSAAVVRAAMAWWRQDGSFHLEAELIEACRAHDETLDDEKEGRHE